MLMRYDPFREIDRFTDGLFGNGTRSPWFPMDATRRGDAIEVYFDLPGVLPDSIDLSVENDVLTLTAERQWTPEEDVEVLARERTQGRFSRQVLLGEALDTDRIEARYENGVLFVRIPVAENARPRKVAVQSGDRQAIEVGANA